MAQSKKVVLFLVEGVTEEISIGYVVTKLNKDNKTFFQIVNTDITSDYESNSSNILKRIFEQVKINISENHFSKKDVIKIVHLVDTDGTFIPEKNVLFRNIKEIKYSTEYIYTNNVEKIRSRNLNKSKILNKLSSTGEINGIPYEVYFLSTNLEHVLHNIQNAKDSEKKFLAEKIQDEYYNKPEEFVKFICNKDIAVNGSYMQTWDFIKKENNSLNRYTNFNLWFNQD